MVNSSNNRFLGVVLVVLVAYGAFRLIKGNLISEAEDSTYEIDGHKINDYGSIQKPVSNMYGMEGQAVGQEGDSKGYGAEISMITPGFGQNFHGRAVGL